MGGEGGKGAYLRTSFRKKIECRSGSRVKAGGSEENLAYSIRSYTA